MPIVYRVNDPVYGLEPAVTDGSIQGTGLLLDTSFEGSKDAGGYDHAISYDGGVLFVVSNSEYQGLWSTNGDYRSTDLVTTEFGEFLGTFGAISLDDGFFVQGADIDYFVTNSGEQIPTLNGYGLYRANRDGSLQLLTDLDQSILIQSITELGDRFIFQNSSTKAVHLSDGTLSGTGLAPVFLSDSSFSGYETVLADSNNGERVLYIGVADQNIETRINGTKFLEGVSLFSTDGTAEGTIHLDAIGSFTTSLGNDTQLSRIGEYSFLSIKTSKSMTEGIVQFFEYDHEIWQTNGDPNETWKLATLSELYANSPAETALDPTDISGPIPMGNQVGFVVTEQRGIPPHQADLHIFNIGTENSLPSAASLPIRFEHTPSGPYGFFEGKLIYNVKEGANREFYNLDVQSGETSLVFTTSSTQFLYPIHPFYNLGDTLVFVVGQYVSLTDSVVTTLYGWQGDGTDVVELGSTILPRWDLSNSERWVESTLRQDGEKLYFNDGYQLQVTDGTLTNTKVLDADVQAILGVTPYSVPAIAGSLQASAGSDFDANGYDDILFFNSSTRTVGQFQMPTGNWSGIGTAGTGWEARGTGLYDNDDTSADILWFNINTRAVGRFDMVDGAVASWSGIGRAGVGWEVMGSGDFNGDGTDDILWFNDTTNSLGQYRMNEGVSSWAGIGSTGSAWELAGIGDFNGDAIEDLLWWNAITSSLGQFRMTDTGSVWNSVAKLGSGFSVVETGDFDGDGIDDILVLNTSNRKLGLFVMEEGHAQWASLGTAGLGWTVSGTGDFDNSGTDDILWQHSDGRIGLYKMDGSNYDWDSIGFAGAAWEILL